MPYYKVRIRVREVNREYGFPAENIEEAKIMMKAYFNGAISENTKLYEVKEA